MILERLDTSGELRVIFDDGRAFTDYELLDATLGLGVYEG